MRLKQFAAAWKMRSGQSYHLEKQLRFYQLDVVQPVTGVKGQLRLAEDSDRLLLIQWFEAFSQEVIVDGSESVEQRIASQFSQKALYIWQDQVPVSLGRSCYLSTNLKNSTSNHIYTTVGYQPVGDWQRYRFESSAIPA